MRALNVLIPSTHTHTQTYVHVHTYMYVHIVSYLQCLCSGQQTVHPDDGTHHARGNAVETERSVEEVAHKEYPSAKRNGEERLPKRDHGSVQENGRPVQEEEGGEGDPHGEGDAPVIKVVEPAADLLGAAVLQWIEHGTCVCVCVCVCVRVQCFIVAIV